MKTGTILILTLMISAAICQDETDKKSVVGQAVGLMPSPSAFSKIVLSVLKFLGILKFLTYTQNILGVLK